MLAVIAVDQFSKFAVEARYALHEFEPITGFFNLGLTYNPGAAFSFLANHDGWQRWFFTVLAVAAAAFFMFQIYHSRQKIVQNVGFAMIAGGALGNMLDRLRIGMVVDFLDFHWQDMHWPAFNLADSAIFIGVVLVLWSELFQKKSSVRRATGSIRFLGVERENHFRIFTGTSAADRAISSQYTDARSAPANPRFDPID